MPPTRTDHKAAQAQRQATAEETCAILARGWYDVGGERIAIADQITRCAANTVFHPATSSHHASLGASTSSAPTQIDVQTVGTMAAARALAEAGHNVAALNFASAKNPGGGFRKGAQAQEECLARCSALYSSLTSPAAAGFYAAVHKGGDGLYTDGLIYSPAVTVLRDDAEALARPWRCAFVTAAAPNAGIARDRGASAERLRAVLVERADRVLGAAVAHGHDAIVLGAWGCGVFKNEPRDVARALPRCSPASTATALRASSSPSSAAARRPGGLPRDVWRRGAGGGDGGGGAHPGGAHPGDTHAAAGRLLPRDGL